MIKKTVFLICMVLVCFGIASPCFGEQKLLAMPVTEPPVIDGLAGDPAWENAQEIITLDKSSKMPITIKAVYTDTEFFVQVSFPDKDESRTHKSWIWNKGREIYTVGHDREDIIIFKWNMDSDPVDLSIVADNPHHADIWYWKACRTDATGYADDKSHLLSQTEEQDSTKIISKSGKTMYLLRKSDDGTSAYRIDLITDYEGKTLPRYIHQQPTGSRSDVKAKGVWENGTWTIEFRRNFITGHQDDVQFTTARKYLFGVSRYEIAGRNANKELSDPLYGTGDVNEPLWLEFNK
ncbi:MAG: hypothetical protein GQ556_05945 [Desulfobacterales bacterium]|nr:hypothetical protein [Desulfobacterales bacterium]